MTSSTTRQKPQRLQETHSLENHQPVQSPQRNRVVSIELFRIVAMIAIIALHTSPFGFSDRTLPALLDLIGRFSVPFFFIASGYFFGEKIRAGKEAMPTFWRSAKRLSSLYIAWSLFYFLVPIKFLYDIRLGTWWSLVLKNLDHQRGNLLIVGTTYVLWFLPALVLGLGLVAVCVAKGWQKQLPYVAVTIYGIGLWWGSYSLLWANNDEMDFAIDTRNGLFFSALYVTFGWLISTQKKRWASAKIAGAIAIGGLLLQFLEAKDLSAAAAVPFRSFDYLIGTTAFGVGIFLLALAKPHWGSQWPVLQWSRYTLGIFLLHPLVISIIKPLNNRFNNPVWELTLPIAVYLLSLAASILLARHRWLRQWVA
jgi:surface polysaccharide O-acyltransferase-like enzyme